MPIDLSKVSTGRVETAPRVVIYGTSGIGKTKFACGAPDPFVIDADKGSHSFDTRRVIPATWSEVRGWISAVEVGQVKCKTLILDSVTALETMSHAELFHGSTIDKYDGGYGKGDTVAYMAWREVLHQLESVWKQGIGIVIVGHISVKAFSDPTGPSYDRFEIACRPKIAGLITQWSDYVLMAREEIITQRVDHKSKAVTTGVRWAYTKRCPAYDAKARGSMNFPEKVLLGWDSFSDAVRNDVERFGALQSEVSQMLSEISDAEFADKVKAFLSKSPEKIVEVHNRVAAKLVEVRASKETDE